MIKQRTEIIKQQAHKIVEDINLLLSYLETVQNDMQNLKNDELIVIQKIESYKKREEEYKKADARIEEAKKLEFELKQEKSNLLIERGLVEKEKQLNRQTRQDLEFLEKKLNAKQQRLQSLIAD